jgi:hypothetical protein
LDGLGSFGIPIAATTAFQCHATHYDTEHLSVDSSFHSTDIDQDHQHRLSGTLLCNITADSL